MDLHFDPKEGLKTMKKGMAPSCWIYKIDFQNFVENEKHLFGELLHIGCGINVTASSSNMRLYNRSGIGDHD